MTRQQFLEEINRWRKLIDFCYEEDCDFCDNIYDEDGKDSFYNNLLVDMASGANDWQDLFRQLSDIPEGYDYYILDNYSGDMRIADYDDFQEIKDQVLEWGDDREIWVEDCDEHPEELEDPEELAEEEINDGDQDIETLPPDVLFTSGAEILTVIKSVEKAKASEEAYALEQLLTI